MKSFSDIVINSAEAMRLSERISKTFAQHKRGTGTVDREKFSEFITDEYTVSGFRVLTVEGEDSQNRHVVFLHGGGYVTEAMSAHRRIIEELVKRYGLKVSFIDYPLAPENKYEKTHEVVLAAYGEITARNDSDEFYLFGDSAGGGLALAFLQVLRDRKVSPFPRKTVLFSPWVDLSMSNPALKDADETDPLIDLEGMRIAANHYIGDGDNTSPLVSPIFGRMDNLGSIFLICGTNEILNPDCRRLKNKLMAAYGTDVKFYEGEKMMHDWILAFPFFPQSVKALDMIGRYYTE